MSCAVSFPTSKSAAAFLASWKILKPKPDCFNAAVCSAVPFLRLVKNFTFFSVIPGAYFLFKSLNCCAIIFFSAIDSELASFFS